MIDVDVQQKIIDHVDQTEYEVDEMEKLKAH
jgi:hypothetical protein